MIVNKIVGYSYKYTLVGGGQGTAYFATTNLVLVLKAIIRLKELRPIQSGLIAPEVRAQSNIEMGTQYTFKMVG